MGAKLVAPSPSAPEDLVPKAYVDRYATCVVDFGGPAEDTVAYAEVSAAWASTARPVLCLPHPDGTPDHSAEDFIVESLTAAAVSVTPGVGFTVAAQAPRGTFGRYLITCAG